MDENDGKNAAYPKVEHVRGPWVLAQSKSHNNRWYYFNTLTGKSVWNLSQTELDKAEKVVNKIIQFEPQEPTEIAPPITNISPDVVYNQVATDHPLLNNVLPIPNVAPMVVPIIAAPVPVENTSISLSNRFKSIAKPKINFASLVNDFKPQKNNTILDKRSKFKSRAIGPNDLRKKLNAKRQVLNPKIVVPNNIGVRGEDERVTVPQTNFGIENDFQGLNVSDGRPPSQGMIQNGVIPYNDIIHKNEDNYELSQQSHLKNGATRLDVRPLKEKLNCVDAEFWFIMVDTNVLISDLHFLKKLLQADEVCNLLVSYKVIDELQKKARGPPDFVQRKSLIALDFIKDSLSSGRAVTDYDILKKIEGDVSRPLADDIILDSCLRLEKTDCHFMLLSNDKLLHMKTQSTSVLTMTCDEVRMCLHLPPPLDNINIDQPVTITINTNVPNNANFQQRTNSVTDFDISKRIRTKSASDVYSEAPKSSLYHHLDLPKVSIQNKVELNRNVMAVEPLSNSQDILPSGRNDGIHCTGYISDGGGRSQMSVPQYVPSLGYQNGVEKNSEAMFRNMRNEKTFSNTDYSEDESYSQVFHTTASSTGNRSQAVFRNMRNERTIYNTDDEHEAGSQTFRTNVVHQQIPPFDFQNEIGNSQSILRNMRNDRINYKTDDEYEAQCQTFQNRVVPQHVPPFVFQNQVENNSQALFRNMTNHKTNSNPDISEDEGRRQIFQVKSPSQQMPQFNFPNEEECNSQVPFRKFRINKTNSNTDISDNEGRSQVFQNKASPHCIPTLNKNRNDKSSTNTDISDDEVSSQVSQNKPATHQQPHVNFQNEVDNCSQASFRSVRNGKVSPDDEHEKRGQLFQKKALSQHMPPIHFQKEIESTSHLRGLFRNVRNDTTKSSTDISEDESRSQTFQKKIVPNLNNSQALFRNVRSNKSNSNTDISEDEGRSQVFQKNALPHQIPPFCFQKEVQPRNTSQESFRNMSNDKPNFTTSNAHEIGKRIFQNQPLNQNRRTAAEIIRENDSVRNSYRNNLKSASDNNLRPRSKSTSESVDLPANNVFKKPVQFDLIAETSRPRTVPEKIVYDIPKSNQRQNPYPWKSTHLNEAPNNERNKNDKSPMKTNGTNVSRQMATEKLIPGDVTKRNTNVTKPRIVTNAEKINNGIGQHVKQNLAEVLKTKLAPIPSSQDLPKTRITNMKVQQNCDVLTNKLIDKQTESQSDTRDIDNRTIKRREIRLKQSTKVSSDNNTNSNGRKRWWRRRKDVSHTETESITKLSDNKVSPTKSDSDKDSYAPKKINPGRQFDSSRIVEESSTSGSDFVSNATNSSFAERIDNLKSIFMSKSQLKEMDTMSQERQMFVIDNESMRENLRINSDEWTLRFMQIMDEVLTQILEQSPVGTVPFTAPWTVHEATLCIQHKFHYNETIRNLTAEFATILFNVRDERGTRNVPAGTARNNCSEMNPDKFMEMFSYGYMLVDALMAVVVNCEDVNTALESLNRLLSDIKGVNEISFIDNNIQMDELDGTHMEDDSIRANVTEDSRIQFETQPPTNCDKPNATRPVEVKEVDFMQNLSLKLRDSNNVDTKSENGVYKPKTPEIDDSPQVNGPRVMMTFTKCKEFEDRLNKKSIYSDLNYESEAQSRNSYVSDSLMDMGGDIDNISDCMDLKDEYRRKDKFLQRLLSHLQKSFFQVHAFCQKISVELSSNDVLEPHRKLEIMDNTDQASSSLSSLLITLRKFLESDSDVVQALLDTVGGDIFGNSIQQNTKREILQKCGAQVKLLQESLNLIRSVADMA